MIEVCEKARNEERRRSYFEIINQVLDSARNGIGVAALMDRTNTSHEQLKERYFPFLNDQKLLVVTSDNKYRTTDRGMKVSEKISKLFEKFPEIATFPSDYSFSS